MRRHFMAVNEWQSNVSQFKIDKEVECTKQTETINLLEQRILKMQTGLLFFAYFFLSLSTKLEFMQIIF